MKAKIFNPFNVALNQVNQNLHSNEGIGTVCAGIASTITNNSMGISEVSAECNIMLVKLGYYNVEGNFQTTSEMIANSIRYAVQKGALN